MDGPRTLPATWIVALVASALAGCREPGDASPSDSPTITVSARKSAAGPARAGEEEAPDAAARERARAMARYAQGDAPVYPELSRRLGEEGTVELRIGVLPDGSVRSLGIGRSSGYPRLDEAALAAARTWRFNPRTGGGEVETISYRVVFQLVEGE